ncbi:fused MFS/spermidine synthase [Lysobacter solisilvae (ex Woo and Kim 2020)]|uniref:Fused MFS/spermidine synthase n=1 Tax=Agrilutibacter terrestris TaxID=2865112 RepID=A0A7H0FX07_9GAMM|nr:fused MFS/spermidine synthase [Lysobacter terrestris]QNP40573.1 fused MFS/spermidine synthase [Lysobacter terrestris]
MESIVERWRAWLAKWLGARRTEVPPHLRKPRLRRLKHTLELQFAHGVSQSAMVAADPQRLLVDYTRTMLGALLFVPQPRRVGLVGLGGGSQAKYCFRHLPDARIEVVENNPHVLALRRRFQVPDDDARFQVHLDDGARFLHERRGRYDLLLVDAYDETGIPAALSTQAFYDDCRDALTTAGAMATNLYCRDAAMHVERLQQAFGAERVLVVEETRQSNRVAFAWRGDAATAQAMSLSATAQQDLAAVFATVGSALRAQRTG